MIQFVCKMSVGKNFKCENEESKEKSGTFLNGIYYNRIKVASFKLFI